MATLSPGSPQATGPEEPFPAAVSSAGIGTITERDFPGLEKLSDETRYHDGADRRRANRTRHKFITQMTPWSPGHPSIPFEVILEDISETGVGLIHSSPLEMGLRHLLTVPQGAQDKPIMREYQVCRCDRRSDGNYSIGLILASAADAPGAPPARKRITSQRTKILFLIFGIVGLLVVTFCPL
jgi:hypothetical protein